MERRAAKTLTAARVKSAGPGKHHDGGGFGLYLRVEPNGSRFWVQRLTIHGKRRELGLGSPPLVSLADAREAAFENKRIVRGGGNPLAEKQRQRDALTFQQAVEKYLASKLDEFRNEKHQKQWRSTLDTYARPALGELPVRSITMSDILRVLEPIWSTKTETASRLRGRIEAVLSWATVAGYREGDNPARWKGNLSEVLPKPARVARAGNHPAVALADMPRWWEDLQGRAGMAAQALQFLTLTACRSGEVRGMVWGEVDLGSPGPSPSAAVWTIPAERMKAGREHRVPLTQEAVALLSRLPRLEGSEVVFFAPRGGPLSDMSLSAVTRRIHKAEADAGREGYLDPRSKRPAVPHGIRSTFRDWADERGYPRDMAEIALAHTVGTEVERAYRRSDMLERRRGMLEAWGRFLEGKGAEKLVQLRASI
ncbi:MAG: integrase arm-type DNA-binding domain-containing protein [Alphaproteobacteria bacterium]|nr:integrase arm-type DNA-binding domain-containing protein [Alphaproteobacteria bacterium]MCB9931436.1 integrase arm-type DNA-binding domain-containing protein [Alphaproteobacteria bacterium]